MIRGSRPCVHVHTRPRVVDFTQPVGRRKVVAKDALVDGLRGMSESSYYVGKSIILFTMFYCSMNWWHYRSMRKEFEDAEEERNKQDKKDKK